MGKVRLEQPEVEDVTLDSDPKAVKFETASAKIGTGKTENDLGLDLSSSDDENPFGGIDDEPELDDWVIARYDGTPGTSKAFHKQLVNGVKAIFPLGEHRIARYYFIKGARRSGNVDFAENPGHKLMKMVDNRPIFFVQKVPTQYQEDILGYVKAISEKRGKTLTFAADQL